MATVKLRLTAGTDDANTLANLLATLEGVESVEEVADLMPHMDDPDSSSAGLPDDMGPGTHLLVVEAEDEARAREVVRVAQEAARRLGAALELESDELRPGG